MTAKSLPLFLPSSPSSTPPPPELALKDMPAASNSPLSIHSSSPTPSPPRVRIPLPSPSVALTLCRKRARTVYIDVPPFPPGLSARDYSPGIPFLASEEEEDGNTLLGLAGPATMISRAAADAEQTRMDNSRPASHTGSLLLSGSQPQNSGRQRQPSSKKLRTEKNATGNSDLESAPKKRSVKIPARWVAELADKGRDEDYQPGSEPVKKALRRSLRLAAGTS